MYVYVMYLNVSYTTVATQYTGIRFIIIPSLLLLIINVFNYIYGSHDTMQVGS
jgi:hypothetical protein